MFIGNSLIYIHTFYVYTSIYTHFFYKKPVYKKQGLKSHSG